MEAENGAIGFEVVLEPGRGDGDRSMELASAQLTRELNRLSGTTARQNAGQPPPPGSRAGEGLADVLRLSVEFAPVAAVILQGVQLLGSWSALRPGRSVRVRRQGGEELEVTGLSSEDQQRLIQSWLDDRQSRTEGTAPTRAPENLNPTPDEPNGPPDGHGASS
ncbi:hypothetical protein [Streptomyces sp. CAI-85]|uniref:effector-associated constant component EACC1 n=1 Tax=Streptomyces sp. CAI-85 TaxID=1472662 RepID=UPI0015870DB8|nr:hypothetical protein [Streptomyces sp. CAI-85]NUV58810.1 hypothetical protein [Streptomyces sp. CAI-85]